MTDINYLNLLKKSWFDFRANLVLFIPILLSMALGLGFVVLLGIEFLVFFLVFSRAILSNPLVILSPIGILLGSIFVIIDFFVLVWIGAYIRSMLIGMLRDIMLYKKTTINNMFAYGKKYVGRYFKVSLIITVIYFLPLVFLGGINTLVFLSSKIAGIVLIVISSFIYIIYFIFLMFFLFFIEPIFVTENKPAIDIVRSSFRYTKKNFLHVFLTWGLSLAVAFVIGMAMTIIMLPFAVGMNLASALSGALFIVLMIVKSLADIIRVIVNVILNLALSLFQFNSYFAKNNLYRTKKVGKI